MPSTPPSSTSTETHHHYDDNHGNDLDDFQFTYLVIAALLALVVLFIKSIIIAELYNFVGPRMFSETSFKKITWLTSVALVIIFDILF